MTSEVEMTTRRPYLIRAAYEWIVDNGLTPHFLVDTKVEGVKVPVAHIDEAGRIVLNIAPVAIRNLELGLQVITFNAAFPGLKADIVLPLVSIKAIYAMENGEGMIFDEQLDGPLATDATSGAGLRLVSSADKATATKKKNVAKPKKTTDTVKGTTKNTTPKLRVVKKDDH